MKLAEVPGLNRHETTALPARNRASLKIICFSIALIGGAAIGLKIHMEHKIDNEKERLSALVEKMPVEKIYDSVKERAASLKGAKRVRSVNVSVTETALEPKQSMETTSAKPEMDRKTPISYAKVTAEDIPFAKISGTYHATPELLARIKELLPYLATTEEINRGLERIQNYVIDKSIEANPFLSLERMEEIMADAFVVYKSVAYYDEATEYLKGIGRISANQTPLTLNEILIELGDSGIALVAERLRNRSWEQHAAHGIVVTPLIEDLIEGLATNPPANQLDLEEILTPTAK